MNTFGQYAATRTLRESPAEGAARGGVGIRMGTITTWAGVDLVTGMPVFVYTLPAPTPDVPEVFSEHIPALLDRGRRDDTAYLVFASAPGYAPIGARVTVARLPWLARATARALADAHAANLVHRDFRAEHLYVQGDHVLVEGFGLPWADQPTAFRAPEGPGAAPADVFAWARTLQALVKGDPARLIDGELGRLIGHCLNGKPRERPTAAELVQAIDTILATTRPALEPVATREVPRVDADASTAAARPARAPAAEPAAEPTTEPTTEPTPEPAAGRTAEPAAPSTAEPVVPGAASASSATEQPAANAALTPEPPVGRAAEPAPPADAAPQPAAAPTAERDAAPAEPPPPARRARRERRREPRPAAEERLEHAAIVTPEDLAADEPDVVPREERVAARLDDDGPPPIERRTGSNPIRIGWDDDDSWRRVRAPTPTPPSRRPPLVPAAAAAALVIVVGAAFLASRAAMPPGAETTAPAATAGTTAPAATTPEATTPAAAGIVVTFRLDPAPAKPGRLTVLEVPNGSGLKAGDVLAQVPGPVLFPTPGRYRLSVAVDGYDAQPFDLNVTRAEDIILKIDAK